MPKFTRLPKNVIPLHYVLSLEPDLVNFTFTGSESVSVDVRESTDTIILNGCDLKIPDAAFEAANGCRLPSQQVDIDEQEQRITIKFAEELKPGKGTLHLSFTGILNDKLKGFYRAKYPAADGSSPDRYVACTQFEATDARRAFPCWDEPAIKATFKVTLVAPKGNIALSNMPVISESLREDGKTSYVFDVTPIMSTYLVAFIVGEFDFVEATSKHNVKVRVYTPPGKKEQGRFALDVNVDSLDFCTDYFNVPYPLSKLDIVALSDFAMGAMENWGLITGRENIILCDLANISPHQMQLLAMVNAHEVSHQWFGNLVTMEWWTHLWLNEGFARFMQYFCIEKILPHLHIWDQFVTDCVFLALSLDSLRGSHPVEVPVNDPSEIDQIFDEISYNKGAAIIAMLHEYIGDDHFSKGMSLYLNRFKYSNAETNDLWSALEEASSKSISQLMSTWTRQKGYPLITVSQSQDGDKRVIKMSQEKFVSSGDLTADEKECMWMVPISVVSASSPDKTIAKTVLSSRSGELVVADVKPDEWVKLNPRFIGMYRVKYSQDMLDALLPAIISKKMAPLDRLGILGDIFALVPPGGISTVQALKVIEAFKGEDVQIVWSSIASCLISLLSLLSGTETYDSYLEWGRKFLSTIKSKVTWDKKENEAHTDALLRSTIISLLCLFEDASAVEESKRLFDAHANKSLVIPADVRASVFASVARHADEKVYNTLIRLFKQAESSDEKNKVSSALGQVRDSALIAKALEFSISDDMRVGDALHPLASFAINKNGREAVWEFYKKKISIFQDRYKDSAIHPIMVKRMLSSHARAEIADDIESFFAKNQLNLDPTVSQVTESIRLKAAWLNRDQEEIKSFLNSTSQ